MASRAAGRSGERGSRRRRHRDPQRRRRARSTGEAHRRRCARASEVSPTSGRTRESRSSSRCSQSGAFGIDVGQGPPLFGRAMSGPSTRCWCHRGAVIGPVSCLRADLRPIPICGCGQTVDIVPTLQELHALLQLVVQLSLPLRTHSPSTRRGTWALRQRLSWSASWSGRRPAESSRPVWWPGRASTARNPASDIPARRVEDSTHLEEDRLSGLTIQEMEIHK